MADTKPTANDFTGAVAKNLKVRLEHITEGHSKFYEIYEYRGTNQYYYNTAVRWGKIGTDGKLSVKKRNHYISGWWHKLNTQKLDKGYKVVTKPTTIAAVKIQKKIMKNPRFATLECD